MVFLPSFFSSNDCPTTPIAPATANSSSIIGTFRTAPDHHLFTSSSGGGNRSISFVVGGDLGGQSYCRRVGGGGVVVVVGYPIFSIMRALSPDPTVCEFPSMP